jgi:hypothetical protein
MEDFVTFEIAVKLKEKGFKTLCFAYYTNTNDLYFNYSHKAGAKYSDCYLSHNLMPKDSVSGKFFDAPTISQALKWLREEKNIHISIMLFMFQEGWCFEIIQIGKNLKLITTQRNSCNTYEEAALAGIQYVIDNLI